MMERHAHYALVGVIACLLAIVAAVFVVWLGQFQFDRQYDLYRVVFQGPVRGLSEGGDVQFNGIKVGAIQRIKLATADPNKVILTIRIQGDTPVRVDSEATTELQGISGIDVVQISAGTPSKPLLRDVDHSERPTIRARPNALSSLFLGGGEVLQAATVALTRVTRVLSDRNIADLSAGVSDLRKTADALADHRAMFGKIDRATGDIQSTAAAVRQFAHGDGRRALADMAATAHDLKGTVHDAHAAVARLDGQGGVIATTTIPRINATLDSVGKAADSVNGLIRDLRNDPRATLAKPKGRELEIHP